MCIRDSPDEIIARNGYKSMPETEAERRLLASLLACDHELHGLPGFYTKDGAWTLAGANGFLIPVRNLSLIHIFAEGNRTDRCRRHAVLQRCFALGKAFTACGAQRAAFHTGRQVLDACAKLLQGLLALHILLCGSGLKLFSLLVQRVDLRLVSDQIIRFELLERALTFLFQLLKLRDLAFELRAVGNDLFCFCLLYTSSPAIMERWINKIATLEQKKQHYEEILRRDCLLYTSRCV